MTIADKIRYHRKELNLSQSELGERLGVQKNAVSKWETGRVDAIPSQKVKLMAEIFGVKPSYLIDDTADPDGSGSVKRELLSIVQGLSDEECAALVRILKK